MITMTFNFMIFWH